MKKVILTIVLLAGTAASAHHTGGQPTRWTPDGCGYQTYAQYLACTQG